MKNKKTMVVIIACIALVLTFTMLVSYAYWRVTKTQTGTNTINGACLSIRLEEYYDEDDNLIEGFTLDNAWPLSDQDGLNQEGYKFKVVNECEESLTYQVVLDSLDTGNNINHNVVKVSIDNGINKYGDLTDAPAEDLEYTPIASKVVFTGQIPGSTNNTVGEVEHTIKLWISESSTNDDIGKSFSSKVRVIAGQQLPHQEYALTPGECFEFDESTGTITGYDEENCTTDYLVVPQKINGVMVKSIDFLYGTNNPIERTDHLISWNYVDLTKATGLETVGQMAFNSYNGIDQELVIPDSVGTIRSQAFERFNGTKLTLGNSIETIGRRAFYNYIGANQELVIPDSVTEIGQYAFYNYNGSKLTIGTRVETIGAGVFASYVGINQELIIPDNVRIIGGGAFENYNGMKLILENGVEEIWGDAFIDYKGANQELIIPDSVKTIGSLAFGSFNGAKLTIGTRVEEFGNSAFQSYVGTNQKLMIPNSVKTIGAAAFQSYVGTNQELVIPNSVITIKNHAFSNYEGANQELVIPDSVETVGKSAFRNYKGTKLTIGNNVEEIGQSAFYNYRGANQELIIPDSVKIIGENGFGLFMGTKLTLGSGVETISQEAFKSYPGQIDVKKTESDFGSVTTGEDWKHPDAWLNFLLP